MSTDFLQSSNFNKQQQQQPQQQQELSPTLFSFNLMNKANNNANSSPDSGLKEMSFDSNMSDAFNASNTSMDLNINLKNFNTNNIELQQKSQVDYKSPLHATNNLSYLYNIKRKLDSFKNPEISKIQEQSLNDLNKINHATVNKENILIKVSKKQLNPIQIESYSLYMNTPSSSSLAAASTSVTTTTSTIKKSPPIFFNSPYKKNKSISNSSIDNYSLSEGYDSLKQNDEDIVKLHLSQTNKYDCNTSIINGKNNNEQQNSSDDEEKLLKFSN